MVVGNGAGEGGSLLHNARYDFNDSALPYGQLSPASPSASSKRRNERAETRPARVHVSSMCRGAPEIAGTRRPLRRFRARRRGGRGFTGLWVTDCVRRAAGRTSIRFRPDGASLPFVIRRIDRRLRVAGAGAPSGRTRPPHPPTARDDRRAPAARLGSGSTKADFDIVGADYETRFKTLMSSSTSCARRGRANGSMPPASAR